jgi:hypothetical protein
MIFEAVPRGKQQYIILTGIRFHARAGGNTSSKVFGGIRFLNRTVP